MPNITLATTKDAPDILTLQKLAFAIEAKRYNKPDIPPMVETVDDFLPYFDDHIFYKLEENGRLLGAVNIKIEDNTGHIGRLIVRPDSHNQGFGKQLMAHIEKEHANLARFELFTGYRSHKNISFYQKQNYTIFKTVMLEEDFGFVYMEKINRL